MSYSEDNKKETIEKQINHELELVVNGDTVAFFAVVLSNRSLLNEDEFTDYINKYGETIPMPNLAGQRHMELVPTIIEIDNGLSVEERLRLAEAIHRLAQNIRKSALQK